MEAKTKTNQQPPSIWTPPFTIVTDTRERAPFAFDDITKRIEGRDVPVEINTVRRRLRTGDYSIEGAEDKICVERKSVHDCIQTVVRGRKRFTKELERMSDMEWSAVVVEGEWKSVIMECTSTKFNPVSLDSSILAWMLKYPRVQWIFRPSKWCAGKTVYKLFELYWRKRLNANTPAPNN